jgi:hypothetical protein
MGSEQLMFTAEDLQNPDLLKNQEEARKKMQQRREERDPEREALQRELQEQY